MRDTEVMNRINIGRYHRLVRSKVRLEIRIQNREKQMIIKFLKTVINLTKTVRKVQGYQVEVKKKY